mgnify:CR=1 FL=1
MEWHEIDLTSLFEAVRERGPDVDAERTIWAFERAWHVARLDPELLRYLLVATVCLIAHDDGSTPRAVLEETFRRSVSDSEWHERFEPLFV